MDNHESQLNGCAYLGKADDLSEILSAHHIDEVIIALPNSQHETIKSSIETCDFHAKRVRMIPDLYLYASSNIQINTIGLLPVINLRSLPLDKWENKLLKRFFDICFSAAFFILLGWWIIPLVALIIKLTSRGPVFFKQERWGLNNEKIVEHYPGLSYALRGPGRPETPIIARFALTIIIKKLSPGNLEVNTAEPQHVTPF